MDIAIAPLTDGDLKPLFTDVQNLGFGRVFTDRMFLLNYAADKGWHNPRILKYGPLELDPATLVLHYGQEIFEGMKAFVGPDDQIIFFRPEENVRRFNRSARRMSMPELNEQDVLDAHVLVLHLGGFGIGFLQQRLGIFMIAFGDGGADLLDVGAHGRTDKGVAGVANLVLAVAFFR